METLEKGGKYLIKNYGRMDVAFEKGEGMKLWDSEGKEYQDFLAGIAVVNLGHSNKKVAEAVYEQAKELVHTSNLYHIGPQAELAKKLCEKSFAQRVFFCNSGTEANEAALKLARKWASENKEGAHEIITTRGSFHGRTMFSLSVTGQDKFHKGFGPLVPGVVTVPYNDIPAVEEAINDKTAAVLVEPVQGEGGVIVPDKDYLKGLRDICCENRTLLIFDEVQTGMGRTGRMFGYEHAGVAPDIMTMAKALGNGFPIGAMLTTDSIAQAFGPGSHAATFGGNFLACRAALATLDEFEEKDILAHASKIGEYFLAELRKIGDKHDCVMDIRGQGLLLGMELDRPGASVVNSLFIKGFIINCTADKVLRFVPPLIVDKEDIDKLLPELDGALSDLENSSQE
jgi:acetylornithine/N-succinyldiaminopimelate aminotransferase